MRVVWLAWVRLELLSGAPAIAIGYSEHAITGFCFKNVLSTFAFIWEFVSDVGMWNTDAKPISCINIAGSCY